MDREVAAFLPIILYGVIVVGFAAVVIFITTFLPKPNRHTPAKDMPYESGMDPEGDARKHFDVKFYLMAILFLVFDVELLFLYPWAVVAYPAVGQPRTAAQLPAELSVPVFVTMLMFIATLFLGYVYAWRKGVFQWR